MDDEYNISEELDEWQQIPSPGSMDKAQWMSDNDTVVIKDDFFSDCSAVPPTNHEDLPVTTSQEIQIPEAPEPLYSTSLSSSSLSDDEKDNTKVETDGAKSEVGRWMRMLVGAWSSRLVQAAREMKNYAFCRISLWYSVFATTGVLSMVLMSLWCMRVQRWRKRVQMERIEHLMLLIKERDQKINQLLLQIAHMNEMLLARQRVPVLRVG